MRNRPPSCEGFYREHDVESGKVQNVSQCLLTFPKVYLYCRPFLLYINSLPSHLKVFLLHYTIITPYPAQNKTARHQSLTSVILATQEIEIRRLCSSATKRKDGQMGLHKIKKLLHNKRNGL
jgi:hypothetical protein